MVSVRGVTTSLVLKYLAAFLLLVGLLSIDGKPIFSRTISSKGYRLSNDENSLTFHQARRGSHADGIHQSRSDVALLRERSLAKRGSCLSRGQSTTWDCSSETPSVAECKSQVQSFGQVGKKRSVFYTGFAGGNAISKCKGYFECRRRQFGKVVLWDGIVNNGWLDAQALAIAQGNPTIDPARVGDPFLKRLSQAFAEASTGDVYLCTPDDNAPDNNFGDQTAWGGWEYPALTRNPDVTTIYRVDPDGEEGLRVIWRQGDPPSPKDPRGAEPLPF